MASNLNI